MKAEEARLAQVEAARRAAEEGVAVPEPRVTTWQGLWVSAREIKRALGEGLCGSLQPGVLNSAVKQVRVETVRAVLKGRKLSKPLPPTASDFTQGSLKTSLKDVNFSLTVTQLEEKMRQTPKFQVRRRPWPPPAPPYVAVVIAAVAPSAGHPS